MVPLKLLFYYVELVGDGEVQQQKQPKIGTGKCPNAANKIVIQHAAGAGSAVELAQADSHSWEHSVAEQLSVLLLLAGYRSS